MSAPWGGRRLHFVGVGGAGMSGYVRAAHALGAQVSGSDRADSPYLERLRADGVLEASIGHDAANVPTGEDVEVVYSSAIAPENPERVAARERGLRERPRAELLGELSARKRTIAVAGTHGKTTTASMLVHMLRAAGMAPGWLVGAPVGGGLPNAHWGAGEWLVVEADESDRSMLSLEVEIAVLTNAELDHHSSFASLAELRAAFRQFLEKPPHAVVWDRADLLELRAGAVTAYDARDVTLAAVTTFDAEGPALAAVTTFDAEGPALAAVTTFDAEGPALAAVTTFDAEGPAVAVSTTSDAENPTLAAGGARFAWRDREVQLAVPGAHNAVNAAGALEAARIAGADPALAIEGLAGFKGAGRRFQKLGATAGGALVYDDYAHHPTEVRATLKAARTLGPRRLVAVFQPHLYSRTALLAREFGEALAIADVVVVLDVYPARERAEDHPGVSGLTIAQAAADAANGRQVMWLPTFADAEPVLRGVLVGGDLCVAMGAGDIDALGRLLVEVGGPREVGAATAVRKGAMGGTAPR